MKDLQDLSTEELLAELARRRGDSGQSLGTMEEAAFENSKDFGKIQFEQWLQTQEEQEPKEARVCKGCGQKLLPQAQKRSRTLHTVHGEFRYARYYYYCRECRRGESPLDEQIGAPAEGEASDGLKKRALDFAINAPYEEASERFFMHYGLTLSTHVLRCMVERLPLPSFESTERCTSDERITVQVDGTMLPTRQGYKEAKLATISAEKHHVQGNKAKRGMLTQARYVASLGSVDAFADLLKPALVKRLGPKQRSRGEQGPEVVWVGDGAPWLWKLQKKLCPQAIPILDWVHAVSHGLQCGIEFFGQQHPGLQSLWQQRIKQLLFDGKVDQLLQELSQCRIFVRGQKRKTLNQLISYYRANRKRMDYQRHRDAGRIIGSGLVESAHRHVLQIRMKRAGQHWSPKGAEKMARLRCLYKTHGPQNFFDSAMKHAA